MFSHNSKNRCGIYCDNAKQNKTKKIKVNHFFKNIFSFLFFWGDPDMFLTGFVRFPHTKALNTEGFLRRSEHVTILCVYVCL